ncbi:MAG: trypsin-like peptidase domain-containing protein [Fimbriimonadaceae bacterium]|nr:trypsin-like peptidase domain-containing protein [Fimbriimonadaceae bacterium]
MSAWKKTLGMPATWIAAGALIIGGVAVANNIKNTSLPMSHGPVLAVQPAGLPSSEGASALHQIDQALSDVADQAAKGVVFVRVSDGRGASEGSGFVYRADGWIVTNDHVVGPSDEATITLHDGREFKGKVIHANDPQLDLAVVKIDAKDLTPLVIADSRLVRPGQFAIAVGSPFGLNDTVTIGHISGLDRGGGVTDPRFGRRGYVGMIQTDAAINPGNSGGPLLNIDGQVVGVNTTIFTQPGSTMFGGTGGSIGIGFAISSDVVQVVADELIANGKYTRGFFGAIPMDVKPYKLKEMGLEGGAVLQSVSAGGPAEKAGLREDDVITELDGRKMMNNLDVRTELYKKSPGDSVTVKYRRGSETKSAEIKLAGVPTGPAAQVQTTPRSLPDPFADDGPDFFSPKQDEAPSDHSGSPKIGVSVQALDDAMRKQFSVPDSGKGVVVVSVEPRTFASRIGMRAGDVLQTINGKAVNSIDDIRSAMKGMKWGDKIAIVYTRYTNRVSQTYSVDMPLQ